MKMRAQMENLKKQSSPDNNQSSATKAASKSSPKEYFSDAIAPKLETSNKRPKKPDSRNQSGSSSEKLSKKSSRIDGGRFSWTKLLTEMPHLRVFFHQVFL